MELGQLVHLHYLDQEGERRALKVMDEVAGSWKKLGTLFNYDVNRIARNHMGGDYAMDCCLEVLGRWFSNGCIVITSGLEDAKWALYPS